MNDFMSNSVVPGDFYKVGALADYAILGAKRTYKKGESVFIPGDTPNALLYVMSGSLKAYAIREDGSEIFFYGANQYDMVGTLFPYKDNPMHIVAAEKTIICAFSRDQLWEIVRENKDLLFEILKNYTSKVNFFKNRILNTDFISVPTKVLRMLYSIVKTSGVVMQDGSCVASVALSQRTISEITGVHYVTVSKVLKRFKEEGILEKTKDKIIVYHLDKIYELLTSEDILNDFKY